jgi:hypothetical protein
MTATPSVPGTLMVDPVGNEIVEIGGVGPQSQQCTVNQIASGGTANAGTFTANGATGVVVANANVTANTIVLIGINTIGGSQGAQPTVTTLTPGVSFTVVGTSGDTSKYNYKLLNGS